jgi:hypothetical protein
LAVTARRRKGIAVADLTADGDLRNDSSRPMGGEERGVDHGSGR